MIDRGEWFAERRCEQADYRTNDATRQLLARKHFTAVVGPAGVGKSTVMNRAAEIDPRFKRTSDKTSRPARPNDEAGLYQYIVTDADFEQLAQDIAAHEPVQYAIDPTNDVIYLSYINDYPGDYNMGDVWASAVPDFQKLGFQTMTTVALVADPEDWEHWFRQRFVPGDDVAKRRIREAQMALPWLIDHQAEIKWLKNTRGDIDTAAAGLIRLSEGGESAVDGTKLAKGMLEAAKRLETIF